MLLKSIMVISSLSLVTFSALAAAPTPTLKWSIGVQESTGDKRYEGKDLEAFIKKPLELKDIDTKCEFSKESKQMALPNETIAVTCILGKGAFVARTEVLCLKQKGFFVTMPFFLGKPDPKKAGHPEKVSALIGITCSAD